MPTLLTTRTYPHAIEPNDPARRGRRAGADFRFGPYAAFPTHGRNGHRWWVVDTVLAGMRHEDDGDGFVRGGDSFEAVTQDFADFFTEASL